jgi:hypothetical protein
VIQTAEKWGLYWGGYGWNSGCATTATQRTIVSRDPPHFEFRGTPRQARAIAEFNLGNDPNRICIAVVDPAGQDAEQCGYTPRPAAGARLPVELDPPVGAVAAMINLTAVQPAERGYLTLEDCAPRSGARETSALTFAAGQTIATMAVVPVSEDGRFCIYRSTSVHSIVDVVAYLAADGERLWFDPTPPTRLTDTRSEQSCDLAAHCEIGPVPDGAQRLIPTEDGAPRIANLAVVGGSGPGFLQAGRCGSLGTDHVFSNLNYTSSAARSNLAVVAGGDDGSCVFAMRSAHVIVDELGRLDAESGYGWRLSAPRRALDTRRCTDAWCDGRPAAGSVIRLDLGTDAPGAAIAITVADPQQAGYVSVGTCSEIGSGSEPGTSNLNHARGQTVTNLALVELDGGELCIFSSAATHVIIDVQAELVEEQGVGVVTVDPARVHDSRLD